MTFVHPPSAIITVSSPSPASLIIQHHPVCQYRSFQIAHCPASFLFSSPDTRPLFIQPDPTCTARRHRHSISGQMSYFKLLGYNVSKKLTGSANSLFSTAVISGSSSAPNLKDMVPPHASAVAGKHYCRLISTPDLWFDVCPIRPGFTTSSYRSLTRSRSIQTNLHNHISHMYKEADQSWFVQ